MRGSIHLVGIGGVGMSALAQAYLDAGYAVSGADRSLRADGSRTPVLEALARERGVPFRAVRLQSREEARSAPTPVTTYALFRDGEHLTNEQMNDKRFLKLLGAE